MLCLLNLIQTTVTPDLNLPNEFIFIHIPENYENKGFSISLPDEGGFLFAFSQFKNIKIYF